MLNDTCMPNREIMIHNNWNQRRAKYLNLKKIVTFMHAFGLIIVLNDSYFDKFMMNLRLQQAYPKCQFTFFFSISMNNIDRSINALKGIQTASFYFRWRPPQLAQISQPRRQYKHRWHQAPRQIEASPSRVASSPQSGPNSVLRPRLVYVALRTRVWCFSASFTALQNSGWYCGTLETP